MFRPAAGFSMSTLKPKGINQLSQMAVVHEPSDTRMDIVLLLEDTWMLINQALKSINGL
jgi:hypothetical protein